VDALRDTQGNIVICGIMEHIEQAGIHSGDSACSIPTQSIPEETLATIRKWTMEVAEALGVVGLINIQYAVQVRGLCVFWGGGGSRAPLHGGERAARALDG
jgi:carbamoyl-phosphate synthase large subunit